MAKNHHPRLPVLVLTGFLGSGKTSLLNGLLEQWPRSAVLINEFGAVPVDQRLVERHAIPVTVLGGGCLCCQMRGALVPTLKNLWMAWNAQPQFDRLMIEASGVASPEPVLDVLLRERWLAPRIQLQAVVTTVAVPAALAQIDRFPEAMAQVAWADVLALTQADLAEAEDLGILRARLAQLAPDTPQWPAAFGQLDGERLLASACRGFRRTPAEGEAPAHPFHSFSLRLENPIPWPRLESLLKTLLDRHPTRLVRVKGVVYLPEEACPVVVQAASGRLHPPTPLTRRDSDDGIGRLVFISEGRLEGLEEAARALLAGTGHSPL